MQRTITRHSVSAKILLSLTLLVILLPTMSAVETELRQAIRDDDKTAIRALLKGGTNANAHSDSGASMLMYAAAYSSSTDVMQWLIDAGADVNTAASNGATALMWAAGDPAKVKLLLARGAIVNAKTADGNTPLRVAIRHRNLESIGLLLAGGADLKAADQTPALLRGAYASEEPGVQRVLQRALAGADVVIKEAKDLRFSALAFNLSNAPALNALLDRGADPNEQYRFETLTISTLGLAGFTGEVDAVGSLLDRGANADAKGQRGLTALMLAAAGSRPSPAAVRLLLARTHDVNAMDEGGRTALDWALLQGETEVARLIRNAGGLVRRAPDRVDSPAPPRPAATAIEAAIKRLQPVSPTFYEKTHCVSCHNQSLLSMAVNFAGREGVPVDRELALHPMKTTLELVNIVGEELLMAPCGPGLTVASMGYELLALQQEGARPSAASDAMALCVAAAQRSDGSWRVRDLRPPMLDNSPIIYTALALNGISAFAPPGRRTEMQARAARAREFLRAASPRDTQDEAFKLMGLVWAKVRPAEIAAQSGRLLALQRADGGWGQWPTMNTDAYATGQALYALRVSGHSRRSPQYERGVQYLLRTQRQDGSWFVPSRAFAIQTYIDAGFPHARDQFISTAATSWAVMALTYGLAPSPSIQRQAAERLQFRAPGVQAFSDARGF